MKKNKSIKKGLAVVVLMLSMTLGYISIQSINAAGEFTLTATPTPRVEVSYDAGSTANVADATAFVAAVQNTAITRIVMTQPITLTTANVTSINAVNLNRSLQIDGSGFKLSHAGGNVFKLNSATQASTFQLRNITIEKTAGANTSTLVSNGSAYWDILFDGVTINTGLKYAHIVSGAGNPSIFFRGDNEFMEHNDDFAEVMALVVFEDNSKVIMNEPGAGGTNFWDANNVGAIVHFGENSISEIKGNSSWPIFLYFRQYYVHMNADVKLYKDSSTTGVITSDSFASTIQIDSGAKFVLLNLAGPAYGDQNQKAEIIANPGADVQFIGDRAGVGGGVRFQNANSKLVLNAPANFNIENKNTAYSAFTSSSTTNQALQILDADIGAWTKGTATVAPTNPFPFNSVTLIAGNTTALSGTSAALTSIWDTSSYARIAKSTRPTISSTDLSFGINRTMPIVSTYTPSDATLTYSSANSGIASVDTNGQVTGVAAGTTTITITATSPESVATSTTIQVTITNTAPTLNVPAFTQINVNDPFDPLAGVSANDMEDGVLSNISVSGTVNPAVAGVYPLTYSVTDSDNNTTTKTRVVLVNNGTFVVGTNYILSASNFTKEIELVNTSDASIKTEANVKLYDKATGAISAGTVNISNNGGYNATVGTYNITFAVASEPALTKTITATVTATAQKNAAKAELDTKANELRTAIDALPGLSSSEKLAAKTAITNELNIAKANVDAATTISSITAAKDAGILAMTQIFDTQQAKSDQTILNAKNGLDQTASDLKAAINLLPGLTPTQITDATTAIDVELALAKANVDAATNLTGISSAITNGEAAMTAIYDNYKALSDQAIADAKAAAITELNQKATLIRAAINNVEGATQADKEGARAEIDTILSNAITAVNASTTFTQITSEKDLGLAAMDAVLVELQERVNDALKTAKDEAVANLDAALAAAKAAVNALPNLSLAQRDAAIQELDAAYLIAETAIYDATNTSGITAALNNGTRAFDAIVVDATLLDAKNLAVAQLETKAADIKAAIDALPGLTAQEKLDGKAAIDAELLTGTANIHAATTTTFVQGALNVSRAAMDQIYVDLEGTSVQALAAAKTNAVAELTQKAADAKSIIDALTNLSEAEKTAAKDAIDVALADATLAINAAPDLVAVATELNNGIFAMEEIVQDAQLLDLKNAAILELNAKAVEAKASIDALANLSLVEKNTYKAAIDAALASSITSVNNATTAIEIEDIVIGTKDAFNLEVQNATLLNEKNRAKEELAAKALSTKTAIDLLAGLTQAEKDAAKAAIDDELVNGSAAIDAGTRIGEVLSALDTSKLAMDAIYDNVSASSAQVIANAKTDAINELNATATAARAAIDALTNLTIAEKTAAKNAITSDLNNAIAAVNAATTLPDITTAKDAGVSAINANVTAAQLLDAQAGSIAELEDRAEQIKVAIDALVGLSAAEKTAAKNAVDAAKADGIAAVQAATTISAVQAAQTAADAAMDQILSDLETSLAQALADAKTAAIDELDAKAAQAILDVDALTTLSASEKQAVKDAITSALNTAKTAVNAAVTVEEVTLEKTAGLNAIDNLVSAATLADAKAAAIAALQAKAIEIKNAIDALPGLTTQQKIDGKAAIDAELSTGTSNINGATSLANVTSALDTSTQAMDTILADLIVINNETLASDKAAATMALNDAATAAKAAIDALVNLSTEEKATAKAAIDAELATALSAVASATTPTGITDAQNLGLAAIQQQLVDAELLDAKNGAKVELEQKALEAISTINALQNLTDTEKAAAIDQINADKIAAMDAVDAATTITRVIDAKNNGIGDFEQTVLDAQLLDAKNAAKASLEAKATEVIAAINALPGLTVVEKAAAVAAIENELTNGLAAIEAGTTATEITTALDSSVAIMDGILADLEAQSEAAIAAAKSAAITSLNDAATAAKAAIDALVNLSPAEKTAAKAAVDTELATAITAVNAATTPTQIDTALTNGLTAIDQVVLEATLEDARIVARAELEAKAQTVIDAIHALPGLTAAEKATAVQTIQNELTNGLAAINSGSTVAGITTALTDSKTAMDTLLANLEAQSDAAIDTAQSNAITALNDAANAAKAAIDALASLSPAEKTAAKAAIDAELATAIANVEAATTLATIDTALTTGKAAIQQIVTDASLEDAKISAKAQLEAKAQAVIDAIGGLAGLSDAERAAGIAAIQNELTRGLSAIDQATTITTVNAELATSKTAMDQILTNLTNSNNQAIENARNAAIATLQQKAADVKAAIDALPGLSDAEKAAGKARVDAELANGLAAIQAATTPTEISGALNTSMNEMDNILMGLTNSSNVVIVNAKLEALAELDASADIAKAIINALPNLSDAEKVAALAAVDEALATAKQAIVDATTPIQIGVALNAGNANIAAVAVDAQVLDAKNGATAALQQKAAEVKAAIDALPGLTDQERLDGKARIDAELTNGLDAINAGTSVLEIRASETISRANMDEIYADISGKLDEVVAAAKVAAEAELNQNAADAKRIINELTNLTAEEKAAAIAAVDTNLAVAIQAVNNATTPSEVATALNSGNAAIATNVVDAQVQDAKNASKAMLEQKALEIKAAIDALPGLTDAEKAEAKALIDEELTKGLAAIDASTTVLDVRASATTSRASMEQILSDLLVKSNAAIEAAKTTAKAQLEQRANEIKKAIDAMPGLSDEQKATAKRLIDEELARGLKAIDASTTIPEIDAAVAASKTAMEQILSGLTGNSNPPETNDASSVISLISLLLLAGATIMGFKRKKVLK